MAPTGQEFVSGAIYSELGDSLLTCDWNTGTMLAFRLDGHGSDRVLGERAVTRDCQLDIALGPGGIIYYSNHGEIRRLLPK